jgi:hypothetical protein
MHILEKPIVTVAIMTEIVVNTTTITDIPPIAIQMENVHMTLMIKQTIPPIIAIHTILTIAKTHWILRMIPTVKILQPSHRKHKQKHLFGKT